MEIPQVSRIKALRLGCDFETYCVEVDCLLEKVPYTKVWLKAGKLGTSIVTSVPLDWYLQCSSLEA